MKRNFRFFLFFLLSNPVQAEIPVYQIDPESSHIEFTATVNGAPSRGTFAKPTGQIRFAPHLLEESRAEVTIPLNSISSFYEEVASTLKEKTWLDVSRYPTAALTVRKFRAQEDGSYLAEALLTLRAISRPVTLQFHVDELTGRSAQATGNAKLKRSDFQVGTGEWEDTSIVADEVEVTFTVKARRE